MLRKLKNLLVGGLLVLLVHMLDKEVESAAKMEQKMFGGTNPSGHRLAHQLLSRFKEWDMRRSLMWYINAAMLIVCAALFTCCAPQTAPKPESEPVMVLDIEIPYSIPVYVLDESSWFEGGTACTPNGMPAIYVQPRFLRIGGDSLKWIILHEMIHIKQTLLHADGCKGFSEEYTRDSLYALKVEAEAYCAVGIVQRLKGAPIDPTPNEALASLMGYRRGWTLADVKNMLLPCIDASILPSTWKSP